MYTIIGLGNPGEKYQNTRHNTGFMVVDFLTKGEEWVGDKKSNYFKTKIGKITYIKPQGFMNKSGKSIPVIIPKRTVVIYDDLDLPAGTFKISFNKSSGGHKGLDSIIKSIKSKEFIRIRVGISPETSIGKLKKPHGEQKILDFLLGDYKKDELLKLKKVFKEIEKAVEIIISEGCSKAMNLFN